jgi:hypothetical protein
MYGVVSSVPWLMAHVCTACDEFGILVTARCCCVVWLLALLACFAVKLHPPAPCRAVLADSPIDSGSLGLRSLDVALASPVSYTQAPDRDARDQEAVPLRLGPLSQSTEMRA